MAYIENGLKPMLKYIKDQNLTDRIFAIEIFNEPEWMIEMMGFTKYRLNLADVQNFTRMCNQIIVAEGFKATIGSVSLKWSCTKGPGCVGDWWGNTNQSFRSIHYYDWMAIDGNAFDPYSSRPEDWGLEGGNVLISQVPSWNVSTVKHGDVNITQQFYLAYKNNWMGVLPWSDQTHETYDWINDALFCHLNWTECNGGLNTTAMSMPIADFIAAMPPKEPAASPKLLFNNLKDHPLGFPSKRERTTFLH